MHYSFKRCKDLYPKRGLGVYYERGCLGTSYGDPRRSMFVSVFVLVGLWEWELQLGWKEDQEKGV